MLKKNLHYLLIFLLIVFSYLLLFVFRSADDNRLFSWRWVFADADAVGFLAIIVVGAVLAFLLSGLSVFERRVKTSLFILFFCSVIPFWTEPELIVDASRYFTQAKHLEMYGIRYFIDEWGKGITAWTDMPAASFLYGLIFKFFGETRLYTQIFTTALFSMTALLTYLIGKTLWDEQVGLLGGMLLLGIPYLLAQVPLMLVDVHTMFFLALSIFTFIKALKQGGIGTITLSAASIFITVFTKYSTWLMLTVLPVVLIIYCVQNAERGAPGAPSVSTSQYIFRASSITLISALLIAPVFIYKFDVISEQIRLLASYQKPGLERWGESFVSTFLFQVHPLVTASACFSIFAAILRRDPKYVIISLPVFLIFLLDIRRIRYTIPVFPLIALMASYGLGKIGDPRLKRFIVQGIVMSSLSISFFAYLPFAEKVSAVNLKRAGEYLNSLDVEQIEVFALPLKDPVVDPSVSVPILDLFTKKKIRYDYITAARDHAEMQKSPLRFTWEYTNPKYYAVRQTRGSEAVAIISEDKDSPLPPNLRKRASAYRLSKVFDSYEGVFKYRTIVRIYRK